MLRQLSRRIDIVQVALGKISGLSLYNKPIAASSLSSGTIWENASDYALIAAAAQMTISSASASDASAGVGARTVLVEGVDGSGALASETLTLNGTSGVTSVNSYKAINRMSVQTAGTNGKNAGAIWMGTGTITTGKPANVYAGMKAGYSRDNTAAFYVPSNYIAILHSLRLGWSGTAITALDIIRTSSAGVISEALADIISGSLRAGVDYVFPNPPIFTAGEMFKINVAATTLNFGGEMNVILAKADAAIFND